MDFFKLFRKYTIKKYKTPKWDKTNTYFTNIRIKDEQPKSKSVAVQLDENGYFNILEIYRKVIKLLNKKIESNCSSMSKERLNWIINNSTDAKEKRMAKDELFNLGQMEQNQDLSIVFKNRAEKIIHNYSIACKNSKVLYFDKRVLHVDKEKKYDQHEILETFLSICQEYVPIKTSNKNQIIKNCCDNAKIISDGNTIYCENCHTTFTDIDHTGSYNDQKRISTNSKPKYYNIKHFVSAIKKSQGIHKKTIDPILDKKQDEYMAHHKIELKDYSIFHLMDLLERDSTLSKYYKDIHLIYRQKTGKQINNLSNIERELPKLYKEQDRLSDTIKLKENSKNSINAYYMVCRISQIHGRIDLRIKNFFCARDEDTIKDYDKCFEKRCKILGWLSEDENLVDYCK
jgi:hypothetical protein